MVKSLNAEKQLHTEYLKQVAVNERKRFRKHFILSMAFGLSSFGQYGVFALMFYFSGVWREKYGLSMENIMVALFTLLFGVSGAAMANHAISNAGPAKDAAKR